MLTFRIRCVGFLYSIVKAVVGLRKTMEIPALFLFCVRQRGKKMLNLKKKLRMKARTIIPPMAGVALYKLYKSGTLGDLKDKIFKHNADTSNSDPLPINTADTTPGAPAENIKFDPNVFQYYNDTCAIQSQHLILNKFGVDVTQNELIEVAKLNGWYVTGQGTPVEYVGKLLEHYGVDVKATVGNNIFNIANELSKGHQIIVGVDSGELVNPAMEIGEDFFEGERADHALVVVGLDTTDPNNVKVIVTDPGTGNRQWAYSEEQFMDAWKDSNCFMVTTEKSPEEFNGGLFSALPSFAGIPTDTLQQITEPDMSDIIIELIKENPEGWQEVIEEYPNIFHFNSDGDLEVSNPDTSIF